MKTKEKQLTSSQKRKLLIKGEITIHQKLKQFIEPGGMMHIRAVDPSLKRAFIFKLYKNVKFPLKYRITGKDVVNLYRYNDVFLTNFYIEVFYIPKGKDYKYRPHCPGGEAWGKAGKLYLLKSGDTANVIINSFWTPELLKGTLKKPKNTISSMWVDVKDDLKDLVTKKNKLTILIKTTDQDNQEIILAKKELKNIKVDDLPLPVYFYRGYFGEGIRKILFFPKTKGFFSARLDLYNKEKQFSNYYLLGTRASKKVQISVRVQSLRMIIYKKIKS